MNVSMRAAALLCLLAGTAFAASGGFSPNPRAAEVDIVGLKLGMTVDEVKETLKAHDADLKIRDQQGAITELANSGFLSFVYATTDNAKLKDEIRVDFAPPPHEPRAIMISRFTSYKEGNRPPKNAVIAALKQKYGDSNTGMLNNPVDYDLSWVDAPNGKRITQNREPCTRSAIWPRSSNNNIAFTLSRAIPENCGLALYSHLIGGNHLNAATKDLANALLVSVVDWEQIRYIQDVTRKHIETKAVQDASTTGAPKL